jgi:hypothetical protein
MYQSLQERIEKTNEQRITMALTLSTIMKNVTGDISINMRCSVACTVIDMLESHMIPEDTSLIKLLSDSVDIVCKEAEELTGYTDFRSKLKSIVQKGKEEARRTMEGEKILNSIIGNINLN